MPDPYITVGQKLDAIMQAVANLLGYATSMNAEQLLQCSGEPVNYIPRLPNINTPYTINYWFDEGDFRTNETMGAGRIANEASLLLMIRFYTRTIVQAGKNSKVWDSKSWAMLALIVNAFHIKNLYSGTPDLPWRNLVADKANKISYQPMRVIEPSKIAVRGKGGDGDDSWGEADIPIEIKFTLPLTIDAVTGL